jgi:hypothetical protein
MTQADYQKLYRAARNSFANVSESTLKGLRTILQESTQAVSAVVASATKAGLSDLTTGSWAQINSQLVESAARWASSVEDAVPRTITKGYSSIAKIDTKHLFDMVDQIGGTELITRVGVENLIVSINDDILQSFANRVYKDGYNFQARIWNDLLPHTLKEGATVLRPGGVFGDYQYRIKNLIGSGLAQQRDVIDISKDIELYVRKSLLDSGVDTKELIFKPGRYGQLKPGTSEFIKRVASRPDWRAIRLVRSELYASMQDAVTQNAGLNPAMSRKVNWVLTPGAQHECICPDLAADSPYLINNVPGYPHSNCLCTIIPILRDGNQFREDLKRFVKGGKVDYLDEWYNNSYLPAQF